MIDWMQSAEHIKHPFPNQKELSLLALTTGLQEKQVKTWLSNQSYRKRYWVPAVLKQGGQVDCTSRKGLIAVWPEKPSVPSDTSMSESTTAAAGETPPSTAPASQGDACTLTAEWRLAGAEGTKKAAAGESNATFNFGSAPAPLPFGLSTSTSPSTRFGPHD
jgi:hypothetical protein